jgi:hypothetical protein
MFFSNIDLKSELEEIMTTKKKTPPLIQVGAWVLALIVFAVGFWHTHLGLKEMKPFGYEWGGLVVAGIVLLLLLITYWFAVNGKKIALTFYILCGVIFFVCNLNYFYPSYMARTLIQNEASSLNDTLQKYTNGTISGLQGGREEEAVADYLRLSSIKDQISTEISNQGYGPNARKLTDDFNSISEKYLAAPISISTAVGSVSSDTTDMKRQREQIEPLFDQVLANLMLQGILKVAAPDLFAKGSMELNSLSKEYTPKLERIMADNYTEYNLDSLKGSQNVIDIVSLVAKLNTSIDKINKGNDKENPILERLDEDTHPRADKLGKIKYSLLSIKERIKEIDTWAIIILCLFIDLIVPLAIYMLLRKTDSETNGNNSSNNGTNRPSSF